MKQVIHQGRNKGIAVDQEGSPMAEGSIRGGHDGAALIPIGDDLEEELGPLACSQVDSPVHR